MLKETFTWYVDAEQPKKGFQSRHVATVVIRRKDGLDGTPVYYVGVASKHPKDKLPFVKSEGRTLATTRAVHANACFSMDELLRETRRALCREVKDTQTLLLIDSKRLFERIKFVLEKYNERAAS